MTIEDIINEEWIKRYGGDPVTDLKILTNRVVKIAEDRDCWVANAAANQKEYQKLESKLNEIKSN